LLYHAVKMDAKVYILTNIKLTRVSTSLTGEGNKFVTVLHAVKTVNVYQFKGLIDFRRADTDSMSQQSRAYEQREPSTG